MIKIVSVTKSFGDIKALDDVTLNIDDGEFMFITGLTAAGKTTLLKLIIREEIPETGEIIIDGKNIVKLNDKALAIYRQTLGIVFQDFKILFERTVRENIEVALAVLNIDKSEWDARVKKVLGLVGIGDKIDYFPAQLSGGELQRVGLARALVVNPKIVIADEPTGNLDWNTAEEIIDLLETVNKEGKTVIVATHHKVLVDKFPGRVIEFAKGKIVKDSKSKLKKEDKKKEKE